MKLKVRIITLLLFLTALISAQEPDPENQRNVSRLDADDLAFTVDTAEMNVISASRSSKKIGELPITIYVVTKEEIIRNHYNSLIDILKSLPGVRVSQPGSGELGESFELRGLVGNLYTMILINGLPVKPSAVAGMPIGAQLPVRQAERIEVIYGPAAAVYGADAVSGVINIITREAEKGTFAMGDIGLGQLGYRSGNFMVGGKTGTNRNIMQYTFYGGLTEVSDLNVKKGYDDVYNPLHQLQKNNVKFNIGGTDREPLEITDTFLRSNGIYPEEFVKDNYPSSYEGTLLLPSMEDLPAASNNLGFHINYRGITLSFNNMYRRTHSSLSQSPYFYKFNNPQNYWGENIQSTTLSYNREWTQRIATTTNFSNLIYRMDNNSSMGVTFIEYTDKVYRYSASRDMLFEQLLTVMPADNLEIMSGLTYQYSGNLPQTSFLDAPFRQRDYSSFSTRVNISDTLSGNFGINPLVYHNFSLFSQAYYSLRSFRFMGGVRVDNNSRYGLSFSPRLAGMYIMNTRTSIRASLGYAYKAPSSSLAWQSLAYRSGTNLDSLAYIAVPNPDLKPEKYKSIELGLTRNYKRGISLNLSVYYNVIKDPIIDGLFQTSSLNLPLAIINQQTDSVLKRINSDESLSRLYGVQGTLKMNDIVRSIHLSGEVSLTFGTSSEHFPELLEIATSYATDYISNFKLIPSHYGQMKLSIEPVRNLYIQVSSTWESSWLRLVIPIKSIYDEIFQDRGGSYSMNGVVNYRFGINLNGYIKVSNIFDERYGGPVYSGMKTPLPYNPQTGRGIHLGLTYSLN